MNVWMKRGLQTALLTGGLLALGTGVAAAGDSPLGVTVEVEEVLPAWSVDSPETRPAPSAENAPVVDLDVPVQVSGTAVGIVGEAAADGSAGPAAGGDSGGSLVDADAPVSVCGTAVGVLGEAGAGCGAPAAGGSDGGGSGAGGSVVDVAAPVSVCGTAVGVLGEAEAGCGAPAAGGSDAGGSVVDVAAPVSVCGTAVGVLGEAGAGCGAPAGDGGSDGGSDGGGSGAGGSVVDVDAPVSVCGTAVAVLGEAGAGCGAPAGDGGSDGGSGGDGSGAGGPGAGGLDRSGSVVDVQATTGCRTAVGVPVTAGTASGRPSVQGRPTEPGTCRGARHAASTPSSHGRPQLVSASRSFDDGGSFAGADGPVGPVGELVHAGSDSPVPLLVGFLVLAVGSALTVAAQRRRPATAADIEETEVFLTRRIPRPGVRG